MSISTTFFLKFSGAAVERGLSRVQSAFKSLGGVASKIGRSLVSPFAGIAAAVGGLLAARQLLQTAVEMNNIGEAAQTSEARLRTVIDSMDLFGREAGNVAARLSDLANEQGRLLGLDNKAIRLTQSKLMTFKEIAATADIAGGAFDRATMAALNMAQAGFGSAEMNAVQLGKALNDPIKGITALARSGITFTAQERSKIAVLMESNRTLEAQDMILRAIENQVGGVAKATSDSSARMKETWAQTKEAFAKPFSIHLGQAMDEIAAKIPILADRFAQFGSLIGKTIQDAVNGDLTRFFMIGSMIGEAIMEGMKIIVEQGSLKLGQYVNREIFAGASKYMMTEEEKAAEKKRDAADRQQVLEGRMQDFIQEMKGRYGEALALPAALPQKSGAHPNMPGVSYAPAGHPSQMVDEVGHRIMFDIKRGIDGLNQKLAPQP
jgi:hypothetical protein